MVNAAGLGADLIDAQFGYSRFTVTPRRGELIVYDKLARALVNKIVLPVPTARGKGVLISPTIYGNVMLGPTSEDLQDRTATATSQAGFDFLLEKGRKLMPRLLDEEVTATYSGLRAAIDHPTTSSRPTRASATFSSAESARPGSPREWLSPNTFATNLESAGLKLVAKAELPAPPRMPNIGEAFTRPYQDAEKITRRPGLRHDRVLLRTCHRGRTAGRVQLDHPTGRAGRTTSTDPRDERPLPRLLLRCRSADHLRGFHSSASTSGTIVAPQETHR